MPAPSQNFTLQLGEISRIGSGLTRPECVLTMADGDLYASNGAGGVSRIRPDGRVTHYLGTSVTGTPLAANGFALMRDGSFLIAPVKGGPVQRLYRDGRVELFLDEVEGETLRAPNFVLLDQQERVWICVLTRCDRTSMTHFPRQQRDGFIALADAHGVRIVADNIGFPNEVRIDPTGRYLYTNETLATRLLRYPILAGGALGACEVVCEFDETNMFDGFTLDSEGGAWITTLVSNRLWYVAPDGTPHQVIEDCAAEAVGQLAVHQRSDQGLPLAFLYDIHPRTLCNISSVAFGGPTLRRAYMGNLRGASLYAFDAPVAGMQPAHWHYRFAD